MNSDFDPYYLWLGIPPLEQPPHHYRLLGIALFESNPSVIDSAASRQSTYLHSVATGPQRQASQKLLTEIAAARRALLNAETKSTYDAELKTRLESTTVKPVAPPSARPVAVPIAIPVAVPIAAPVAATAAQSEPAPLSNLFDFSEVGAAREVHPQPPPATGSAPIPKSPVADGLNTVRFADRRIWIIGGASVLILILAFVLWPRGNDEKKTVRSKKAPTKKSPTPAPSKKSKSSTATLPQSDPQTAANNVSTASDKRRRIRFIRIELPRKGVLTLAEVEAFTDGRNVASYGVAEQKNTANGGVAARAIDGNPSGLFADNSQTHTEETDNPWWQLDLGGGYPLDKIVIHNRTDAGSAERLAGFTLLLMDDNRRKILELKDQPAPAPRSEFVVNATAPASPTPGPAKSKPSAK